MLTASQIIVEDEDGEVVKTYELPSSSHSKEGESSDRPGMGRLATWSGMAGLLGGRRESTAGPSSSAPKTEDEKEGNPPQTPTAEIKAHRQGLARMGTWGFGGKGTGSAEKKAEADDEDDDRRIRFTIGGAGRRLTKDDFLREIQGLDPKARGEIVEGSDAPAAVKELARKDASNNSPGNNRLFHAKGPQTAPGKLSAKAVGARMARQLGSDVEETEEETDNEHERMRNKSMANALQLSRRKDAPLADADDHSDMPETAAERKRREAALKSIRDDDEISPAGSSSSSRNGGGRGRARQQDSDDLDEDYEETAAEKRRREAALGLGGGDGKRDDDSDDDGAPRIPPPVKQGTTRGIRFAQSPVRQGKKSEGNL
jgi:sodium/hydrogen antiporter